MLPPRLVGGFTAALLAVSALSNTNASGEVAASRNRALDIVRGGAWLYHEEMDPCGDADMLRTSCAFADHTATRKLQESLRQSCGDGNDGKLSLQVASKTIKHLDPLTITINFGGFAKTDKDWVAAYCIKDPSKPLEDKEYIDYQYVTKATEDGKIQFGPLVNMRCTWQFRYFTTNGDDKYVKLATSEDVEFSQGKQEPLHVRVAVTEKDDEMRVMWVSDPVTAPTVEYGTSPDALTKTASAKGDSYKASDMCESPATTESSIQFSDPGTIYSAVMTGLKRDTTYYYRVRGGGDAPSSKTFKLKTPPAAGTQNGVASFFVFGDLGDWNVQATATFQDKRSATTIQLMRRDMDDPKNNYVAVMHDGDLSYAMGRTYLWDQFGALIEPVATEIPYMVAMGNHEYGYLTGGEGKDPSGVNAPFSPVEGNYKYDSFGECGVPTNKRFIMPANGNQVFWWSTEMGLVHHTVISSEHDYTPGSAMYKWLENDLKNTDRSKTPWLFLHLHRPLYTSEAFDSDHKVALYLRKNIETLLAKYHVDAVFSGHYHAYELTCPVYMDECKSEPLANGLHKAKAPVHIMVGSAGADVDNIGFYDVPWRVDAQLEYGYGRVHVHNETHAQWEFMRNRDEIVASSTWIISDHDWVV